MEADIFCAQLATVVIGPLVAGAQTHAGYTVSNRSSWESHVATEGTSISSLNVRLVPTGRALFGLSRVAVADGSLIHVAAGGAYLLLGYTRDSELDLISVSYVNGVIRDIEVRGKRRETTERAARLELGSANFGFQAFMRRT